MKTTLAGEVFIGTQIDDGWSSLSLSPSLYANGLYTLGSPPPSHLEITNKNIVTF